MKKRLVLVLSFVVVVYSFVFFLILTSLFFLHKDSKYSQAHSLFARTEYKAVPENRINSQVIVSQEDARIAVLRDFFKKYKSPLTPFAAYIVNVSDKFSIDYRLLPSIAMTESNLCKKIPANSYNCWGFGIYGKKVTKFENYEEAIETVARSLAKDYKQQGFEEPQEIMTKYTPSSNGSWAESVNFFMDNIGASL